MTAATRSPRCIRHRRRLDRSLRREYSALPSAGHFWPQRPDNLFLYASGGHISFNSERNMEKNAAKNQRFLDFPCPIPTTVQKGSASNRLYPHPRCRSHAPRGDAPVCYRAAGLLRPYRRFPECRRTQIDAPRRGRRPRRPVARSFHASGGNIPRSRARVTFGRSPKSDQKVCLKPQVSRLPARLAAS